MDEHRIDPDEERRTIVERYTKGREKIRDQIGDWEDPQNLVLFTDRYGFIHDQQLPPRLSKHEAKVRQKEISRTSKWLKMLEQWDKYFPNSEKLRKRVYKGIPNSLRGEVWTRLMEVPQVKKEQEGRYQELLDYGLYNSKDIRQIDLDINRTFRNNDMFRDRFNAKQQELFRILVAYSVYNKEIGYTQGMSQIAALLLMYTSNEEDAFWSLDRLMSGEKYAMHGFFIDGFPKLQRFADHHDKILKKFLPRVYKHFKKFDINATLYTLKWFFQCFLDRVPFSLTLRIWDCFMLDGEMILTCFSYTLLKLHKRSILDKSMEDLISFLQIDLEKDFGYLDDQAIRELQIAINELRKQKMESPAKTNTDAEKPTRPFGMLLQADNVSIMTGTDDRSIAGSINLKNSDSVSLAQTSRTSSEVDQNELENTELDDVEVNDFCKIQRSCSIYDNVDINESIEAAKRLSELTTNSDQRGFFKLQITLS
ncbi:USP6 N-terminal-like protein [Tetranychus urticae]|uniref:Rab-GAP TBC domain-containing protein n=1 Tax=Tetranychus urticae TaxID=32264 RepID=T1K922_TETUR|nr:USP6 N-terminal-like protein [Tetranychus urticae]